MMSEIKRLKNLDRLENYKLEEIYNLVEGLLDEKEKEILDADSAYLFKKIYNDNCAEINGRKYEIMHFNHTKRQKVWAFFSSVNVLIESGNFSFMDTDKFREIETIIFETVIFERKKLSNAHFEKYPFGYAKWVTIMLGAISYPFFSEGLID